MEQGGLKNMPSNTEVTNIPNSIVIVGLTFAIIYGLSVGIVFPWYAWLVLGILYLIVSGTWIFVSSERKDEITNGNLKEQSARTLMMEKRAKMQDRLAELFEAKMYIAKEEFEMLKWSNRRAKRKAEEMEK
jgi:hypothetical protein